MQRSCSQGKLRPLSYFTLATNDDTPSESLRVTTVVGTFLTAINQGDLILKRRYFPSVWKVALTYTGPFIVATYGAVKAKRTFVI